MDIISILCLKCRHEMEYDESNKSNSYDQSVYKCMKCGNEILILFDRD